MGDLEGPWSPSEAGLMHISAEASTNREMRCDGTTAETKLLEMDVTAKVRKKHKH